MHSSKEKLGRAILQNSTFSHTIFFALKKSCTVLFFAIWNSLVMAKKAILAYLAMLVSSCNALVMHMLTSICFPWVVKLSLSVLRQQLSRYVDDQKKAQLDGIVTYLSFIEALMVC